MNSATKPKEAQNINFQKLRSWNDFDLIMKGATGDSWQEFIEWRQRLPRRRAHFKLLHKIGKNSEHHQVRDISAGAMARTCTNDKCKTWQFQVEPKLAFQSTIMLVRGKKCALTRNSTGRIHRTYYSTAAAQPDAHIHRWHRD